MPTAQMQRTKASPQELTNPTRTIRVQLTQDQIDLLVSYALRNGYERKNPTHSIDLTEQNAIARHGMMLRLGFSEYSY
jgi:hypothetical protein